MSTEPLGRIRPHSEAADHFIKVFRQQEEGIKTKFAKSGEHTTFATIVLSQAQGSLRCSHSLRVEARVAAESCVPAYGACRQCYSVCCAVHFVRVAHCHSHGTDYCPCFRDKESRYRKAGLHSSGSETS